MNTCRAILPLPFFHAGSQELSPARPQKISFVLKVDRSAGLLHYYQFLFPCIANEMCRNTCMYLQVSSRPFVRKAASSNRLQRAGSYSNFKRKKNVLNIKITVPLKQVEYPSWWPSRHTRASHASGSPSGFVSGHTSCSQAAEGCGIS